MEVLESWYCSSIRGDQGAKGVCIKHDINRKLSLWGRYIQESVVYMRVFLPDLKSRL